MFILEVVSKYISNRNDETCSVLCIRWKGRSYNGKGRSYSWGCHTLPVNRPTIKNRFEGLHDHTLSILVIDTAARKFLWRICLRTILPGYINWNIILLRPTSHIYIYIFFEVNYIWFCSHARHITCIILSQLFRIFASFR